jgi:hypothetical protein
MMERDHPRANDSRWNKVLDTVLYQKAEQVVRETVATARMERNKT